MKLLMLFIIFLQIMVGSLKGQTLKAEKVGWNVGMQSYSFHQFSFTEAVDKTQELGLKYIEVYFGQTLGQDMDGLMDFKMDKSRREKIKAYASSKGVKIVACGVIICENEVEWKQLFEFASDMGIEIITCEPEAKHLDLVEKLANQYEIDVAIHNHPKPSQYWQPEMLLKALQGRSARMGACADVGHWQRMGIDPVRALKMYGMRLKSLHFKDVKAKESGEDEQHDVVWGTGVCNVAVILKELKIQNFKGLFSIEYEYNWDNSIPDIQQCIRNFNQIVDKLF